MDRPLPLWRVEERLRTSKRIRTLPTDRCLFSSLKILIRNRGFVAVPVGGMDSEEPVHWSGL